MEAKDFLKNIRQQFNDFMNPVVPPAAPVTPPAAPVIAADAPKEYEITGGGTCTIDKLDVGGIVMIDGNPAIPGDLELADGTKITVGDNGVITAVTPGAAAPTAPPAPPAFDAATKFTELETSANTKFAEYETKLSAYEQRFAAYDAKLKTQSEMIEKLLQFGQLIVDKPAAPADPAVRKPQNNLFKNEELQYDPAIFS